MTALAPGRRRQAIAIAALGALAVALLGGLSTDIGPWYQALRKPSWQPPDWLFGPVWTFIYACTALAAARAWTAACTAGARRSLLLAIAANALLNLLWSLLFFKLQRPDWALVEVVALWLSILMMLLLFRRHDRVAGLLLLPYLAWVAFAAVLNQAVVRLNP